jgi:hypothetical protein
MSNKGSAFQSGFFGCLGVAVAIVVVLILISIIVSVCATAAVSP